MRITRVSWFLSGLLAASLLAGNTIVAQEVKYVEKDGVTYQETRRVIPRPVLETKMEQQERVIYRDKYSTDFQQSERRYMAPITEYRWEPQWVTPWNPFAAPYVTYRWMPTTRWVERNETVTIPHTRREVVPEKITSNVPVTRQRFVDETHVSSVPIGIKSQTGSGSVTDPFYGDSGVARRESVGGVRRYENDPPSVGDWRPAAESIRR
jgi:hypothetical protein